MTRAANHRSDTMKHMRHWLIAVHLIGAALATQACFDVGYKETLKTSPTGTGQSFLGEWRSANTVTAFPTSQSCTNLVWQVTSQSDTSIAGTFEAACAGDITLTGTATGVIDGNLHITASGTAAGFGATLCNFSLTGTGVLQLDSSIRVDYTGQTCIGPISGTEIIRR
jgi:hypothetical protein